MLQYEIIPVTPFQQNFRLFGGDETKQAAIVDLRDGAMSTFGQEGLNNPFVSEHAVGANG